MTKKIIEVTSEAFNGMEELYDSFTTAAEMLGGYVYDHPLSGRYGIVGILVSDSKLTKREILKFSQER